MTEASHERHLVAEIDCGRNPDALVWVAQRPLHHFWPLLSPYFRDVLLAPQRRSAEDTVSWHWRERADAAPPRASELAGLRKRLAADQQAFVENLARDSGSRSTSAIHAHANVDELGSVMEATIARLASLPDAALACFVCRADAGLRLHSWSAINAASPRCPDEPALVANQPAARGADATSSTRQSRWPMRAAALIALLLMLGGGGWAWSVRSRPNKEISAPARSTESTPPSPRRAAATAEAATAHPNPISRAAAGMNAPDQRGVGLSLSASRPVRIAGGPDSAVGQSDLARELVLPTSEAGIAADSSGTPLSAGAMLPDASVSPGQTSSSAANSAASTSSASQSSGNELAAENSTPEPTHDPTTLKKAALAAKLRAAKAAAADPDDALTKKDAAPATAEPEPEPKAPRPSDAPSDSTPAQPVAEEPAAVVSSPAANAHADSNSRPPGDTARQLAPRRPTARTFRTGSSDDEEDDDAPVADEAAGAAHQNDPHRAPAAAWRQTIRLRISAWRARLLDDAILPTMPRPAGAREDLGVLRGELLQAKTAELPVSFRVPVWRAGLSFAPPTSSARFSWTELELPGEPAATLRTPEGLPFAEIPLETDGELTLRLAADISARFWLRLEHTSDDVPMRDGSARFPWQRTDDPTGLRYEVALNSPAASPLIQFATVRDRLSGWSLTAEIRLRIETSAR